MDGPRLAPLEEVIPLTSLPTRPLLGTALGLLTAATLAVPGALAVPLPTETTTPAPAPTTSAPGASGSSTAAAAGYRFWGFYQQAKGKWEFAQTGPYQVVPKDGAVDGWRYAAAAMADPRSPRAMPSFEDICGKVPGEAGKKRIGVVIDYGRKADATGDAAPPAALARCALVPSGASSAEVLDAVARPREGTGMVCAIDNWPGGTGCGDPVATLSDEAKAADDKIDISVSAPRAQPTAQDAAAPKPAAEQGPNKTLLTGIAVVVVAAAGVAAALLRRRRGAGTADPKA